MGTFRRRTPAKPALGGLLKPLLQTVSSHKQEISDLYHLFSKFTRITVHGKDKVQTLCVSNDLRRVELRYVDVKQTPIDESYAEERPLTACPVRNNQSTVTCLNIQDIRGGMLLYNDFIPIPKGWSEEHALKVYIFEQLEEFLFETKRDLQRVEFMVLPEDFKDEKGDADVSMAKTRMTHLFDSVDTSLKDAKRHNLPIECMVDAFFPFKEKERWDLSDITFERFHCGQKSSLSRTLAEKLVKEQNVDKFSRAPYLQLEKYYNSIGDEVEAKELHYKGHCALRGNAIKPWRKEARGHAQWSWGKWITDTFLMATVGWGHRTRHIFLLIAIFLVFRTLVFSWNKGILVINDAAVKTASGSGFNPPVPEGITSAKGAKVLLSLLYGFAYSLALFVPLINVGYAYWFVPTTRFAEIYAGIHAIAGWILVGLLLAALAGIFKRE